MPSITSTAKTLQRLVSWVWSNPTTILYGWLGTWISLLTYSIYSTGLASALTLATAGVFNVSSAIGLAVPALALFILFSKTVVPAAWSWLEQAAYRVFRKVMKELKEAWEKVQKLMAKIWKKMQELFQTIQKLVDTITGKAANTAKQAVKTVNKVVNALKKLAASQQSSLHQDLAELERIVPESASHTAHLREAIDAAVVQSEGVLGSSDALISEAEASYALLRDHLVGQENLF